MHEANNGNARKYFSGLYSQQYMHGEMARLRAHHANERRGGD
jgi:hypothetical protein